MTFTAAAALVLVTAAALQAQSPGVTGRVVFTGLGVPGVVVTATHGDTLTSTVSAEDGTFRLAGLADGTWTLRAEMTGFVTATRDVTLPFTGPPIEWTLIMHADRDIVASAPALMAASMAASMAEALPVEPVDIITGSSINGAATPFAQPRAFGNNRPNTRTLYNFAINTNLGNSAWNARPYSFAGTAGPVPHYSDTLIGFTVGGPLRIPWLVKYGPNTTLSYEHGVSHTASTQSALMPTLDARLGNFGASPVAVIDPLSGTVFPGNVIPASRISPAAASLLKYYPLPNTVTTTGANYQSPVVSESTRDSGRVALSKALTRKTTVSGTAAFERTLTKSVNLFNFTDRGRQTSLTANLAVSRRVSTRLLLSGRYQLTRAISSVAPFFAHQINVSGDAGITGNDQAAGNWGPPRLSFPGIAGLNDAEQQRIASWVHGVGGEAQIRRGAHNISVGGDVRIHRVDVQSQSNPRGTLTFTGAVTGDAFADFLLGLPTASAIAFGTERTRLRARSYDAYVNDDWRLRAGVTLNVGLRWEYEAPFTEASGRLANLDVAPDFSAIHVVTASDLAGPLSGATYPASLIEPDKRGFQPRLGVSWRPSLGSSTVVRASYGMYRNLGAYQSLAQMIAGQPPFATAFNVQRGPQTPLTLADPFTSSVNAATNTIAIDRRFRAATAENWDASIQHELPASLTVLAAYLGARGRHLMQAFAPNTYPAGATNPCPSCPSGFIMLTSNGTSIRHAGQFTLRRRLYQGLTAQVQYTLSKSEDDASTFHNSGITATSMTIAQNWLDLAAERGPSSFDQRHLVTVQMQYSTGVGLKGGTLIDGFWGSLYKDWTITTEIRAGSALPLTPISFSAVAGTGLIGVRPSLTGVSPSPISSGSYANPAAFTAPAPGTWGDAGRHSIRGPSQFSMDASLSRTFRLRGRLNFDWRVTATNVLNRVTFAAIGTVISSPQFGLPTAANPMRTILMSGRFRF
jgi:hypothetical protein